MSSIPIQFSGLERSNIYIATAKSTGFFLTSESLGVMIYVNISSTAPDLITDAPKFFLNATLGSRDAIVGTMMKTVHPTTKADHESTSYVLPGDTNTLLTINTPLHKISHYPAKLIQGELYFEIGKTKTQDVIAMYLNIE